MSPDINLYHEIPQEVKDAALLLGNYFKKRNIDNWALYDVSSRKASLNAYKMGYDSGLTVAISLAEEYNASGVLICGLENSKYKI